MVLTKVTQRNNKGRTPLCVVSPNGLTDVVKPQQQNGTVVSAMTNAAWTPLHLACRNGHTDTAKLLQQNGIDANKVDKDGDTPLHLAVQEQEFRNQKCPTGDYQA
ncbi:ankyrin repeat-containing protein P1E11.10-like [Octopus vulgaris]|uniref:Ankyrin repeat-containing protein P1E11.10-like n=1 Tax=Octopus vulgaris TaxID=6645 RepID=A0AA36FLF3_OCTVU|nr:ankyrin repeat-containing protein P1E11.10-like [Octopus vulgaris]